MEAEHGKGPYDPIGGVVKKQADMSVRHQKAVIEDPKDFYNRSKNSNLVIDHNFLTTDNYKRSKNFLTSASSNTITIDGTMKIRSVVKSTHKVHSCCFVLHGCKYE